MLLLIPKHLYQGYVHVIISSIMCNEIIQYISVHGPHMKKSWDIWLFITPPDTLWLKS